MSSTVGLVLLVVAGLAAMHLLIIAAIVVSIVLPNPVRQLRDHGPPERWGLSPERLLLPDGSPGWFFENAAATETVLVCHGRSRSKRWMLPLVAALADRYAVLAIDFPAHGENRYGTTTVGLREAASVGGAIRWLADRQRERVLVYGVSMGGAAAILALGNDTPPQARGLVTDGTFDELSTVIDNVARRLPLPQYMRGAALGAARLVIGVDPLDVRPVAAAAYLRVPALFLHGDRDPLVPPSCASVLADAAPDGREGIYPGRHDEPDNEEMQRRVREFFDTLAPD